MTRNDERRITLAIVTRDRPELFRQCLLDTLRAAVHAGYPVIVVDQSGDPSTRALLSSLRQVRVLRSAPGLSEGRNVAVQAAVTEFVAFTDDDVIPTSTWIEDLAAVFEQHPDAAAVCGRGRSPTGALLSGGRPGEHRWPCDPFRLGSGYNLAVRRSAVRALGLFDTSLGAGGRFGSAEDTEMLYRMLRNGWSVVCTDAALVDLPQWRTPPQEWRRSFRYGLGTGALVAKHVIDDPDLRRFALQRAGSQAARALRHVSAQAPIDAMLAAAYLLGMPVGFAGMYLTSNGARSSPRRWVGG